MTLRSIVVCVPARLGSTRLPGKLLATVGDQTVIEHVCDRVVDLVQRLQRIWMPSESEVNVSAFMVTDAEDIAVRCLAKGLPVFRSKRVHESGTSRIAECVRQRLDEPTLRDAIIVNVQGDEPFLCVADVVRLIRDFVSPTVGSTIRREIDAAPVATLVYGNTSVASFLNPSCVKVVRRSGGMAAYFSRAPVPWPRQIFGTDTLAGRALRGDLTMPEGWSFWQHLGIYVYRGWYLANYPERILQDLLADPCDQIEGLEQLAVLREGKAIWTAEAKAAAHGIDTQQDLDEARQHWRVWLSIAQQQDSTDVHGTA